MHGKTRNFWLEDIIKQAWRGMAGMKDALSRERSLFFSGGDVFQTLPSTQISRLLAQDHDTSTAILV